MNLRLKLLNFYERNHASLQRFRLAFLVSVACFAIHAYGVLVDKAPKLLPNLQATAGCVLVGAVFLTLAGEKFFPGSAGANATGSTGASALGLAGANTTDSTGTSAADLAGPVEVRPADSRNARRRLWLQVLLLPFAVAVYFLLQDLPWQYQQMYTWGLIGGLSCLAVYLAYPERRGEELFPQLLCGLVATWGICVLLLATLSLCLLAFSTLIKTVNNKYYLVLSYFIFFVVGVNLFLAYLPRPGEVAQAGSGFFKVVLRVLAPVYLILLLILYGYLGKIALYQSLPVGQMNWYASGATLGLVFFYFSLTGRQDYSWLPRALKWGVAVLLPVIAVQLAGIWIRYQAYGLTAPRYASMLCVVYGLLALVFCFRQSQPKNLFLAAGVMVLLFSLTPLNVLDVPLRQQQQRLLTVLEANGMWQDGQIVAGKELTAADEEKLQGSYQYLIHNAAKERSVFIQQLDKSEVLRKYHSLTQRKSLFLTDDAARSAGLTVAGYSRLYAFSTGTKEKAVVIKDSTGAVLYSYDLTAYVQDLYQSYQGEMARETQNILNKNATLQYVPDDTTLIYFTSLRIFRQEQSGELTFGAQGYVLKK